LASEPLVVDPSAVAWDEHGRRCHAMNLDAGRTPGGAIWSGHQNMFDAHADQITMIRNHCRLFKTRASDRGHESQQRWSGQLP
jgi:hypothetical protein